MPPDVIEAIAPLTAMALVGSFILIGMRMRLSAKQSTGQLDREEFDRLHDAVDGLTDQVHSLTEECTDLNERLDFAERLLTQGRPAEGEKVPAETPV